MKMYLENKNKFQTKINMTKRKLKWNKSTSIMKHECVFLNPAIPQSSHSGFSTHLLPRQAVETVKGCQV